MRKALPILILLAATLAGCRGLSPEARLAADILPRSIDRMASTIEAEETNHQQLLRQPDYRVVAQYAPRAGFEEMFTKARRHVAKAREINDQQVAPLRRQNKPEGAAPIMRAVGLAQNEIQLAKDAVLRVAKLRGALVTASTDLPSFVARARGLAEVAASRDDRFASLVRGSQVRHPAKKDDLAQRLAELKGIDDKIRARYATIAAEHKKASPDLLAVVQADERALAEAVEATEYEKDLEKRLTDLDRTVSRRLEDMRTDIEVTFARSSWDEYSDSDRESEYRYFPAVVPLYVAQRLSDLGGERVDESMVREAGVNPHENMPRGHNRAEYWIEDVEERYYHRYAETVDGATTLTDWVPVSEAVFDQHEKDLGLEIFAKAYGEYDEEAVTTATPPGLAFVGNSHYGRWDGDRWIWLPAFAYYSGLFGGNRYYHRHEWDRWRRSFRNRAPYYGEGEREEEREYGTNGRLSRIYYGDSYWGRSTGFRSYDVSFRGLGPEYRGGGPGGGGK